MGSLRESLGPALAEHGEDVDGVRVVPLLTLDSGTRLALDADSRWVALPAGESSLRAFEPGKEHVLSESLEWKRDHFDEALEHGARRVGLPPDDVVFSFPVTEVVRATLGRGAYLTRLALQWLRPTELRDLRDDIQRVARDGTLPAPVKDLAQRLIVPG